MLYAGFLLRRERLARQWSQEGLCKGICTVSYLSKIEQGKAEPSEDILSLLMARMGLRWQEATEEQKEVIDQAYEILFSQGGGTASTHELPALLNAQDEDAFLYSPLGPDWTLLQRFADDCAPLDEALEVCLNQRQLALQRLLQDRDEEALRLYPSALTYFWAGNHHYARGRLTEALEYLQNGYMIASQEGRVRLMLSIRLTMGNCYANQKNLSAMQQHYAVARRLATALHMEEILTSIDYNIAATQLEMGQHEQALAYFQQLEAPDRMSLHKLAICCEKLGRSEEALAALNRAECAPSSDLPEALEAQMLSLVRLRLTDPDYLKSPAYGELLLDTFRRCREELPSGYALFHLPWVLQWYEANRQYKQALLLLRDFPDGAGKTALS